MITLLVKTEECFISPGTGRSSELPWMEKSQTRSISQQSFYSFRNTVHVIFFSTMMV